MFCRAEAAAQSGISAMDALIWKLSSWDHTVHAFRTLGEVVSGAVCSHSALTRRLSDPTETDRCCQGCLMIHGIELAQHHGERDRYVS